MKAFRMGNYIIAANLEREAVKFFLEETGEDPPGPVCEIDCEEIISGDGEMVKDVINKVLDERSMWLRMGVPSDLDWPFFICGREG